MRDRRSRGPTYRRLLPVNPGQADSLALAVELDVEIAFLADRKLILADLVALGQVGIEVVLAGEDALAGDGAVSRQAGLHRIFDRFAVQNRKHAGQSQANFAGVGVGRTAK